MKNIEHRPGVDANYLLIRHLKLAGHTEKNPLEMIAEIAELPGVDSVSIDGSKPVLNIAYDASRRKLEDVEMILVSYGCEFSGDWWTHFKKNWYYFTEDNLRANAKHVPQCCNKPPR